MPILGIDIGGTRLKAGLVDEGGTIVRKNVAETPTNLKGLRATVASVVQGLTAPGEVPTAVGVGCKGIIDTSTATVITLPGTFKFLEGVRLPDLVAPSFKEAPPVYADNDARAALAGEIVWGAAKGRRNVIMLTLGTGVGGAVLVDGKIMRGASGAAGLLGHVTIAPQGRFCDCGNRGCLETVFSARAIEAEARHAIYRGCECLLTERFGDNLGGLDCKAVFAAADEGDAVARAIRDEAIESLGAAVAGLLHAFDPELVIVGGQIIEAGAALLEPLRRGLSLRTKRYLGRTVPLVLPEVEDSSGIVGAAALTVLG
ncbi:MAG: ROK family protein [Alphaproteobacteria bacterium]|nr:ROK family protein [Alphaproteobacteria bacterium]